MSVLLGRCLLVPDVVVELGAFTGLTLDDPVLGRLDENPLDGDINFVDVSSALVSVSTGRGRSRDLDRTNAGQLSVSFNNEDRRFDPLNGDSDLVTYTVPRKPVRVTSAGSAVFVGVIDDWDFTYSMGGRSVASIEASDAFSLFARELTSGSAVQELSGARIERVLDEAVIPWPTLQRDIQDGNATLAAGVFEGNALTYLQQVEESEAGLIFMTKDGKFGFRERLFSPVSGAVTFTDDGSGIGYDDIQIVYGAELLVNDAVVTSSEGTAVASDATSQVTYGVTTRTVDSLLASGSLQGLADYIVARYSEPEYRIERIRVNMMALTSEQRSDVLSLELGDQADVVFTPNRTGSTIAIRNRVIGISHDITPTEHYVSLSFEALPFDFFILDNNPFGILDGDGVLGF
jgi:hypothetical protein